MRSRNPLKMLAILFAAVGGLFAAQANAVTIYLDTNSSSYVGSVTPGTPSGTSWEQAYIDYLAGMATPSSQNGVMITVGNQDTTADFVRSSNLSGIPNAGELFDSVNDNNTIVVDGFTGYVYAKYDQAKAGVWVWYLSDVTGTLSLPGTFNDHDISHIDLFGTGTVVPEPAVLSLLGFGLVGLGFSRRKKSWS